MKRLTLWVVVLVALPLLAGGCTKKVKLTIMNHGDMTRNVQVTTPDGTVGAGQVGPSDGRLTTTVSVKTSDLPASVRVSAGAGASTSFMVTEDTENRLFFHITRSGALAGPYNEDDVHVEEEQDADITVKSEGEMIVR